MSESREPLFEQGVRPTVDKAFEQLVQLFPEAVSEGKIDFDRLRAALGDFVETRPERYSFTWAGKRAALRAVQAAPLGALIPDVDESVRFPTAEHAFVEGD